MPIILPPVSPTSPDGSIRCEPMDFYGEPLLSKIQAAVVDGGTESDWEIVLRKEDGEPSNLVDLYGTSNGTYTPAPTGVTYTARFREAICGKVTEVGLEVLDAAGGLVQVDIPHCVVDRPGVYVCDVACVTNGRPKKVHSYWLWVDSNTWTQKSNSNSPCLGPPPLSSIRSTLVDDELVKNLLTEHRSYPLSDICEATVKSVRQWNESSPPIGTLTTTYYPYHNLLKEGIQLYLFQMAEEWYRRNHLSYNAGGVSVDDHNRLAEYHKAWQDRYQVFQREMLMIKTRINLNLGHGTVGSGYSWAGEYSGYPTNY